MEKSWEPDGRFTEAGIIPGKGLVILLVCAFGLLIVIGIVLLIWAIPIEEWAMRKIKELQEEAPDKDKMNWEQSRKLAFFEDIANLVQSEAERKRQGLLQALQQSSGDLTPRSKAGIPKDVPRKP